MGSGEFAGYLEAEGEGRGRGFRFLWGTCGLPEMLGHRGPPEVYQFPFISAP